MFPLLTLIASASYIKPSGEKTWNIAMWNTLKLNTIPINTKPEILQSIHSKTLIKSFVAVYYKDLSVTEDLILNVNNWELKLF